MVKQLIAVEQSYTECSSYQTTHIGTQTGRQREIGSGPETANQEHLEINTESLLTHLLTTTIYTQRELSYQLTHALISLENQLNCLLLSPNHTMHLQGCSAHYSVISQ